MKLRLDFFPARISKRTLNMCMKAFRPVFPAVLEAAPEPSSDPSRARWQNFPFAVLTPETNFARIFLCLARLFAFFI